MTAPLEAPAGAPSPIRKGVRSRTRSGVEWVLIIGGALVLALVLRTYVVETFWIPSESMEPTLITGDRILVNKMSYRLHDVRRGDIVVFERPPGAGESQIKDLIKRVVALPGETVESKDGKVYVNDNEVVEPYLRPGTDTSGINRQEVPPGHVFVLGDNRGNSTDSRRFQAIDEDLIVGRAFVRVWPVSSLKML